MFNCPMQSSATSNPFDINRDRTQSFPLSVDLPGNPILWLSIATVPLLIALLSTKALFELMQQAGLASEELFRGDRLPILNLFDVLGSKTDEENY